MLEGNALPRIEPDTPDHSRRIHARTIRSMIGPLLAAVILLASIPVAWWTTDRLEADDDFCNACHLPDGKPLHSQIRADFDEQPPPNLASRHARLTLPTRSSSPGIRCIDCHGGVGLVGRASVKVLSVKDLILYLTGQFDEPTQMSWPLGDADCRQCHPHFEKKTRGFDGEAFHDKAVHNSGLGVDCVECHSAHDTTGDPELWFLNAEVQRGRCAQCHVEYAEP